MTRPYVSRHDLVTLPATLSNGARVIQQYIDRGRRNYVCECPRCSRQWHGQASKIAARKGPIICPECTRRDSRTDGALRGLRQSVEQQKIDAAQRKLDKAAAMLRAHGYQVTAPESGT